MKSKNIIIVILFLVCGSKIYAQQSEKCDFILKSNKFSKAEIMPVQSIVGQDTITINELRFMCTICSCTTKQIMFNQFGKWNKSLPNKTLIWQNVKLFDDRNTRYTIAATGNESYQSLYSSVMVFDENHRDVLSENSEEKQQIIDFFSSLIHHNKDKGKFRKEYTKLQQD